MDSDTAEDCSVWILWLLFCSAIVVLFAVLFTKYLSCGLAFWKNRCKTAEANDTEAELVDLDATVADWHAFYKFKVREEVLAVKRFTNVTVSKRKTQGSEDHSLDCRYTYVM
jgi:hypothetical protein